MIVIYHNPRCSKSRACLNILETSKKEYEIVKYLDDQLTAEALQKLIALLDIKPIELVRKNEAVWKDRFKNKVFSDNELIKIMVNHPKLIERPIVVNGNKAIVGRPPELVLDLLS